MKNGSRRACSFVCLHQTLSVVVHCMGPRVTSLSPGGKQSSSSLPIVNAGPSRADNSRSGDEREEGRVYGRRTLAIAKIREGGGDEPPSFFHHKREEVASLPLHFLSQCLWVCIVPILPPYSPLYPSPIWRARTQMAGIGARRTDTPPVPLRLLPRRLAMGGAALRAGSGPRNPWTPTRCRPGSPRGRGSPAGLCLFCFQRERAPLVPHSTLCAPLRGCQGSSGRPMSRQEVPAKCATTRRRAWEPGGSAPLPGVQAVPWVPTGRLVPTAD